MTTKINEKEYRKIILSMWLQVKWCRGQVFASDRTLLTNTLIFAIEHPKKDRWHVKEIDKDPNISKETLIQSLLWQGGAINVFEFYDHNNEYIGKLYDHSGVICTYKSDLEECKAKFLAHSLEDYANSQDQNGTRISFVPSIPKGWYKSFKEIIKEIVKDPKK